MKKITLGFILIIISLITSCKNKIENTIPIDNTDSITQNEESKSDKTKNVRKILANWVEAFNKKDSDLLFTYYDPESIYASPESPLLKGIDQVRPWYEEVIPLMTGTLKYKEETITVEGNMAVIVLKFYLEPFEVNETEEPFKGRAILVFRKSEEGKWLLLFDMDNTPPDVLIKDFK